MSGHRRDDNSDRSYFQSNRIFEHDGHWFFLTREGTIEGPFADQKQAQLRLEAYIKVICSGVTGEDVGLSLAPLIP